MAHDVFRTIRRPIRPGPRIALILALSLAACSTVQRYLDGSGTPPFRTFYSPNGEVLNGGTLGKPTCSDAMTNWFNRIDANHDGRVTRDEFFADARRQFAIMDSDHDDLITPVELDHYRAPFSPPQDKRTPAGRRRDTSRNSLTAGDTPDPVMSADTRLRNEVDLRDFLIHAEKVFATLDRDRDGSLNRREAVAACKAQEAN